MRTLYASPAASCGPAPPSPTTAMVHKSRLEVLRYHEAYLLAIEAGADGLETALRLADWRYATETWQGEVDELRKARGWATDSPRVGPRPAAWVPPPIAGVSSAISSGMGVAR